MTVRIGVDTGGTFTDVVLYDPDSGRVRSTKTPSTPPDFEEGVLAGIDKILDGAGISPADVSFLSHGTTVGTNAILEGELPELGLITNDGLRDVLEIGDQTRPELYNLQTEKPPALIPRRHRKEVPGRIDSRGNVVDPLDEARVETAVDELADAGVESIVVSMLFSYLDESHERRVGEIVTDRTDVGCALSSDVHPEIREYDRTITTVLNEAVKTRVAAYFERLDAGIAERGIEVPLNVMHSGGGLFSTDQARARAIRTVLSGPAAGAVAARDVADREGFQDAVGIDMGGTSADVSIVQDGTLVRSTEGEINDLPITAPMIDINTVGAGGGSIVWIDEGGALRVGPRSAGADPGPICYGGGGTEPTVTDANLLLGRINPDYFLGGDMSLAVDAARDGFAAEIAEPLGLSVPEAAQAAIDVANASLAREIRRVTVERGNDPARFGLVAFGGAGPLQAASIADEMDMNAVIVPRNPGVFSARGLLLADVRIDESHSYRGEAPDPEPLADQLAGLESALFDRFADQDIPAEDVSVDRAIDVRYEGQSYELTVGVPDGSVDDASLDRIVRRFHDQHERRYGHAMAGEPVEFVTVRATGLVPTPRIEDTLAAPDEDSRRGSREAYFSGSFLETAIHRRQSIGTGATVDGPAILEEAGSTVVVPPASEAEVSPNGNVIISG